MGDQLIFTPPKGGGITLIAFSSVLMPLTIAFVAARLWARQLLHRKLDLNDYLLLIGAVLAVTNATLTILAVVYGGVGYHQLEVMPQLPTLNKIVLALALVWTWANMFVKLSIIHLYLVIFPSKNFKYASYFVVFLTCGYCITNTVQNLLTCQPVAFNWDKSIQGGKCSTHQAPFLASAIINMSIDVIIFALPMPMLWGLQIKKQKKIQLVIIFGLGFLICIISAVRINSIATLEYMDFSHSVVSDGVFSVLEPCCGAINACLPVLQPVGNKLSTTRIFSTLRGTSKGTSKGDDSTKNTEGGVVTIGSNGRKAKFHRMDEDNAHSDDEYPLNNISRV